MAFSKLPSASYVRNPEWPRTPGRRPCPTRNGAVKRDVAHRLDKKKKVGQHSPWEAAPPGRLASCRSRRWGGQWRSRPLPFVGSLWERRKLVKEMGDQKRCEGGSEVKCPVDGQPL